jgi:uncharacterized membrane protein
VYDWLLFFHVLAAFALVTALVLFTAVVIAGYRVETPGAALAYFRVAQPANLLVAAGGLLTLVLGIWLVFEAPGDYHLWDGWVILALVLWAIVAGAGQRTGREYAPAEALATQLAADGNDAPSAELNRMLRNTRSLMFHAIAVGATLLLLVDMIFKPGA